MALLLLVMMRLGLFGLLFLLRMLRLLKLPVRCSDETASSEALEMKVRRCELELFALFLSRDFSVVADYSKAKRNF